MPSDDLELRDSLLADAAEAQVRNGHLPAVQDNARFITGVLDGMDKKAAEKPVQSAQRPATQEKPGAFQAEVKKRCERHGLEMPGGWTVDRAQAPLALGGSMYRRKLMGVAEKRLQARIRLIASRPEWADKLKRVNPLATQGMLGPEKQRLAHIELRKVLAEADEKWGEWWKAPPAAPLYFT